ncbi:MAG: hypothetical protein QM683_05320, partial [Lacrimispora sp.]
RPRPWQGRTPPTEPLAHKMLYFIHFLQHGNYSICFKKMQEVKFNFLLLFSHAEIVVGFEHGELAHQAQNP